MMKTTMTMMRVFTAGIVLLAFAGCDKGTDGPTAATTASGDSVGAPECDEVLKKAAAPDCKDKPGMATLAANHDNWKNGLANSTTKDATLQGCKAAMEAVKAVCGSTRAGGATSASATTATTATTTTGAATTGSGDSVGAPECDEVLKKAAECKDKPGMSAIGANHGNWKNGLANSTTRDATLQACKAAMEAVKAVCGSAQAGGATVGGPWDGKTPFNCTGNESVVITGVTANIASGPAITATGNCNVSFTGCMITTDHGISASGNAVVTFVGGMLKASNTAIDATGNAHVTIQGAKLSGKTHTSGAAKVTK